ncbi:MAG: hypothetical protein Q7R72_01490 [bacterium]|nr:hypothetical protein [bacterium]
MIYYPTKDEAYRTSLQAGDEIWITFSGDVTILRKSIPLVLIEDEGSSASVTMYNQVGAMRSLTPELAVFQARQLASIAGLDINPEPRLREEGVPQYYFEVIAIP